MLKLKILLAALTGGLLLTVGSARADFITSNASSTAENEIHDSSLETASTSTIGVGTVISGVALYTQIGQTGNLHNIAPGFSGEVTAVFSLTVTSVTPDPISHTNVLTFAPTPGFTASLGLAPVTGAMAVIYENDAGHPLTSQLAAGGGTTSTYFADATAGTVNAILGFSGVGGTPTAAESWTGTATNLTFPPSTGLTGEYNANIDLLPYAYAAGTLGTLNIAFGEPNANGSGNTQFFAHGDQKFNQNFPATSPFGVVDDSSLFYRLTPSTFVPEPSTCVLFGMGSVMLVFFRKRRNKVAA